MKYNLIGKNDYVNLIDTILENRGVHNKDEFLKPSVKHVINYSKLNNIHKAVDTVIRIVEGGGELFVQVDSDPDGFTSSAALISYLRKVYPKVKLTWRLHEGKEHGAIYETVPKTAQLVIIPDAGSDQIELHKQLQEDGKEVIVLDHHEVDKESPYAIVVNNQLSPEYENKTLTGIGIVYRFLQAMDEKLGVNYADDYLDLVALGNISDMADMRNLETRYFVYEGLKKVKNPFMKALVEKQAYSIGGSLNPIAVAFYITPLINAVIRMGTMEEKKNMFKAFLGEKGVIFNSRKKESEPLAEGMARIASNQKARQGRLRDKGVAAIDERVAEKGLDKNKILIVNVTDILDKNLTGLIANQVVNTYKRPALMIRHKEGNIFGGSARGYDKGAIKNFKEFLNETGLFIFCEGHPNAFGVSIEAEKLIEVNELINEQLKDVQIDAESYDVDLIIESKKMKKGFVKQICDLKDVWGYQVAEPLIAITNISLNKDDIMKIGKKEDTLKFAYKGIEYIKFKTTDEEFALFESGEAFEVDVVGKCTMNEYGGNSTPQIQVKAFDIVKTKEKEYIF